MKVTSLYWKMKRFFSNDLKKYNIVDVQLFFESYEKTYKSNSRAKMVHCLTLFGINSRSLKEIRNWHFSSL